MTRVKRYGAPTDGYSIKGLIFGLDMGTVKSLPMKFFHPYTVYIPMKGTTDSCFASFDSKKQSSSSSSSSPPPP
jgi:hypothetical protein